MPTGRKNRNCSFITAQEHVCHELIKLNGVTFQDRHLNVQEARQSGIRFNEKRNITKSSFERNMKSVAESIYSPNSKSYYIVRSQEMTKTITLIMRIPL